MTTTPIQHVVILIQENRSFDNFFSTFPGADGAKQGRLHNGTSVPLTKHYLLGSSDVPHSYYSYLTDYDHRKMDGFDLSAAAIHAPPLAPYQFVDPNQIAVYWTLA
ncbi:MAG TPA: alkaline phosphatase family protein, partial [Candidatus Baltobacteraceae bacterium]|nr:alkaline phosphatase family protein [Candidatus Baltobacteraceae bacterium]